MMVLLVDDQPMIGEAMRRLLADQADMELHYCSDPQQAIELANKIRPTVILQDLVMPQIDGLELVRLFRANSASADIPIIVLSTREDPQTKSEAFAAGATDYLVKLPDEVELMARIASHSKAYLNRLQRDEAYRALRESQQKLSETNIELVSANQKLEKAMVETRALHLELANHNQRLEQVVHQRTSELQALADLQAAQDHIVHQERLNAFGLMASGVAHDFNNVLGLTLGFAELLLHGDDNLSNEERVEFTQRIITASQDGAQMVNRLREFHRPEDGEIWERVDLAQLVQQALQLTQPKWSAEAQRRGASINTVAEIEPVPAIKGLTAELREMLTNLIFNATDAIPGSGSITVRARTEANHVVLEVADTGSGMTEEVRQRCLDPFFTTKGDKGTGMGLAMVYGITQRHDAKLEIDTKVGKGTTFRFRFPIDDHVAAEEMPIELSLARPLKVLVVDDQPFICEIMPQHLEQVVMSPRRQAPLGPPSTGSRLDTTISNYKIKQCPIWWRPARCNAKEISPATRVIMLTGFWRR